jgi:putative membrane protein
MEKILSDYDRSQLNQRIAELEKHSNAQFVLAIVKRSDSYAEIPWKAFALGVSIGGLLFFVLNSLLIYWGSDTMLLIAIIAMLLVGGIFALVAVFVPEIAKLFLSKHRADLEVRQLAETFFLKREVFATSNRTGILLFVSLFEHQVILLPDKGLSNQLTNETMQNVIASMTLFLKRNDVKGALEEGLKQLSLILEVKTQSESVKNNANELSNEIIEEKGV